MDFDSSIINFICVINNNCYSVVEEDLQTMDPAQELELSVKARLKPMNDAIEQGNSPVQQFYSGTTVFVTGGSGFLGKQLIEKLFRSCEINKIYMLLRAKKGLTIQQRLASILDDVLYDSLREKQPQFADKIVPLEGDVEHIKLGLSDKDWAMLTDEVNIIFHVAATVKFNEPIKKATLINVRGTREALTLARQCKKLKCFTHTSTAFAHTTASRINSDVEEKFYPCPVPPDVMIEMVETVDEERLDAITPSLIDGWPNTYTFTKALGEELIRTSAGDLPMCVVKPPVVVSTYIEPAPGWIDLKTCFSSPVGGLLAAGLGLLHVLLVNRATTVSYAPLDYVNNALIAAGWDTAEKKKTGDNEIPLYTVSTSGQNTKWGNFSDVLQNERTLRIVTTSKALWYCYCVETSNSLFYWLLTWLLHYIPAYLADGIVDLLGLRPKGIPKLVKVYSRMYTMTLLYKYFIFNYWNMRDDNLRGMIERMSPQDRAIYNCDVTTIDFKEQMLVWAIGLRRFIVKDDLKGSTEGHNRQKYIFKYLNMLFYAAYGYVIYIVLYFVYSLLFKIIYTLFY